MSKFFAIKSVRISAILFGVAMLYGAAGFWLAPKLLRSALIEDIPGETGAIPSVGAIRINPFLLQLEVRDFALSAQSGDRLFGFGRLFVDVGLASVWRRALVFKNIEIEAPFVNAVVASDGALNLAQLKPKSPPPPPKATEAPKSLPRIQISEFRVAQGILSYEDRSVPSQFTTRLEPIAFDLRDFSTDAQGGMFTLTGASKLGEHFELHGHLAVQPIESDGELRIEGLRAQTIWTYAEDRVGFAVDSGQLDLDLHYRFALRSAVELQVELAKAALRDLSVRPKGAAADSGKDNEWIVAPELVVTNGSFDLGARAVHVDTLALTGLKVLAWLNADRSLNLATLAGPAAGSAPAAAAPAPAAGAAAAAPPWSVQLHQFELRDATISLQDRTTNPAVKMMIAPLSLTVSDATLDMTRAVPISLDAKLNDSGEISLSGALTPQPLSADLELKLSGFELKALQPYIDQRTAMSLLDGRLSATAKIAYGKVKPRVLVTANVSLENLHTVDDRLREDFIDWQRLDVLGIAFQQDPDRLGIDRIVALKPYARVIIEADSSLNVARILAGPAGATPTAASPATKPAAATEPAAAPPPPSAPPVIARAKASRATPPQATAPPGEHAAAPFPISIRSVEFQSGQANFSDLSITPNFAAGIQDLHGTVHGLSSQPDSRAQVDLHGGIDQFSPVAITGEVNLLSPALYTDIALSFRNIELSIFNPYSGKFAGYAISKGKLTTDLHYKVDGRKLNATHHVLIDQLEFGEKTDSKDAVSLPVKLAVALLKDRNGLIDLDLPVDGSLDDPNFHFAATVWKILGNLLLKAVTAPFALLGSLFGGGPDLQFVDFHAGAATVDAAGIDKLKVIVKAMKERPQLKLEVPIAALPEIDRPALIEVQLLADLEAQRALPPKAAAAKSGAAAPPRFDELEPAARLPLLTALYGKKFGHPPQFPEGLEGKPANPQAIAAKVEFLETQLRAQIIVDDAALKNLAEQRALALQQDLLSDGTLDPARVFLVTSDKIKSQDGLVRLELSLR
ncbi:MAG TPA: DUF748 domain-containing protein [Steroidobacteraceae bacterium]|nr:DUF748 domain-containing protein [Steroidobacteraceae bacterium]